MKLVLALSIALALALPAGAEHCTTWSTTTPEIDSDPLGLGVAPRFYVDDDLCHMCLFSIWVYQESNGIPGLHRGDEVVDGTCHGLIAADTIIL